MLFINDKEYLVTSNKIYVGDYFKGTEIGHNLCVSISFVKNEEKGYINLDFGFDKNKDINYFINKTYSDMAYNGDIYIEVYDTKEFLDTQINGLVTIKLESITDNKIKTTFEVDDELIKIKYSGYLDIDYNITKETFSS